MIKNITRRKKNCKDKFRKGKNALFDNMCDAE